MYQAVQFEDLPILGSATQWSRLQDLKSWAKFQGLTLQREAFTLDGTVIYLLHDEYGCIARIQPRP